MHLGQSVWNILIERVVDINDIKQRNDIHKGAGLGRSKSCNQLTDINGQTVKRYTVAWCRSEHM